MFARSLLFLAFAGLFFCSTAIPSTLLYYTTMRPVASNSNLKYIPYTASCSKNLYDCGIVSGLYCYGGADKAVYYASTDEADAYANCPTSYAVKIAFNDRQGDIYANSAHFWCNKSGWEYCRAGWCRPVRHFACYKKTV